MLIFSPLLYTGYAGVVFRKSGDGGFILKNSLKNITEPVLAGRGYPSLVKGAGFRVPSRRRSQVQLLLHAFFF